MFDVRPEDPNRTQLGTFAAHQKKSTKVRQNPRQDEEPPIS
jgi:hypothetical protein